MEDYTILNLNADTISVYKDCFDKNGSSKKIENIKWQFFDNTESNSVVNIAYDELHNKAAAIYAVSCVRFKIVNDSVVGTQSLDTITDIDYRGKGLFIKLAKKVYEAAESNSIALVYGFPNGNSIHGFETKLGWTVLDPVPFLIKPLKSKYFTNKVSFLKFLPNINFPFRFKPTKGFKLQEENAFPPEVDLIWESFSHGIKVAVVRDKKYLDWRYIHKPNESYRIIHCYDLQNRYSGFVVLTVKDKHNGRIGYIMELVYDLGKPEAGVELLKFAIGQIREQNADCILSWCLSHSPNYDIFRRCSFFNLPEKFRPIELHFGARTLNKKFESSVNARDSWYISYSDSDTV